MPLMIATITTPRGPSITPATTQQYHGMSTSTFTTGALVVGVNVVPLIENVTSVWKVPSASKQKPDFLMLPSILICPSAKLSARLVIVTPWVSKPPACPHVVGRFAGLVTPS